MVCLNHTHWPFELHGKESLIDAHLNLSVIDNSQSCFITSHFLGLGHPRINFVHHAPIILILIDSTGISNGIFGFLCCHLRL